MVVNRRIVDAIDGSRPRPGSAAAPGALVRTAIALERGSCASEAVFPYPAMGAGTARRGVFQ